PLPTRRSSDLSVFNEGSPMSTDGPHVVPTDGYVNGQRSNHPIGKVSSASWTSTNGSKKGSSAVPGYSGTVFEPIDEFKGDVARVYFYFRSEERRVGKECRSRMTSYLKN